MELTDSDIKRFWSKVNIGAPDECWIWNGSRSTKGDYGVFSVGKRVSCKQLRANRIAYFITNGPIPEGCFICHRCDNPPCCNPAHLWAGSPRDNTRDAMEKFRWATGERSGLALLNDSKVREIRVSYAAGGTTLKKLGAIYGVSWDCIWRVVKRKNWAHVD